MAAGVAQARVRGLRAVLAIWLAWSVVLAADGAPAASPWQLEAWAEAWLPAIYGEVGIGQLRPTIDITPGVALDLLGEGTYGAGVGGIGAYHAPLGLSLFVESFGVIAKDDDDRPGKHAATPFGDFSAGDLDVHQSIAAVNFGVGYRLGEWSLPGRARSFWVEGRAGGRYLHYHANVNHDLSRVRFIGVVTENCADPVLGVRWHLDLADRLAFDMKSDIGGFTAGTQFSWTLDGVLRYRLPWSPGGSTVTLLTGYRGFGFRWKYVGGFLNAFGGPNPQKGRIDLTLQGPVLGIAAGF